jgi:hypothetical protein
MYENQTMRPVENILRRREKDKEKDGEHESNLL